MLRHLSPKTLRETTGPYIPRFLEPLLAVSTSGEAMTQTMKSIVKSFGFESFLYAMSTAPALNRDSQIYFWANQPDEWIRTYDQRAYVEVDPRVTMSALQTTPFVWDDSSFEKTPAIEEFLRHAAEYGICSGVVIPIADPQRGRVALALNSPLKHVDDVRRNAITRSLGDMMLFAAHLHELFVRNVVEKAVPPRHRGAPLSAREVQCLTMASHGLTGPAIAGKLNISERTVHFHFSNINSKLEAANRSEAVAIAIQKGLLPDWTDALFAASRTDSDSWSSRRRAETGN